MIKPVAIDFSARIQQRYPGVPEENLVNQIMNKYRIGIEKPFGSTALILQSLGWSRQDLQAGGNPAEGHSTRMVNMSPRTRMPAPSRLPAARTKANQALTFTNTTSPPTVVGLSPSTTLPVSSVEAGLIPARLSESGGQTALPHQTKEPMTHSGKITPLERPPRLGITPVTHLTPGRPIIQRHVNPSVSTSNSASLAAPASMPPGKIRDGNIPGEHHRGQSWIRHFPEIVVSRHQRTAWNMLPLHTVPGVGGTGEYPTAVSARQFSQESPKMAMVWGENVGHTVTHEALVLPTPVKQQKGSEPVQPPVSASIERFDAAPKPPGTTKGSEHHLQPSLSIPAVADQVCRLIERRLINERDRRGVR